MGVDRVQERTGGRSADIRDRVLAALADLLAESPTGSVTLTQVAERSGVNRSTLHRRWGGMGGLMAEAALEELGAAPPVAPGESPVRAWASEVAKVLNDSSGGVVPFSRVLAYLATLHDPDERREVGEALLRAMSSLDPAAVDNHFRMLDLVELVFAPMYLQHLMGIFRISDDDVDRYCSRFEALAEADRRDRPPPLA